MLVTLKVLGDKKLNYIKKRKGWKKNYHDLHMEYSLIQTQFFKMNTIFISFVNQLHSYK